MVKDIFGALFFKRVSYIKTDYNNKEKVVGMAIQVESAKQRMVIYVDVLDSRVNEETVKQLNDTPATYNAEVNLIDPKIEFKQQGKYTITCSGLMFVKSK